MPGSTDPALTRGFGAVFTDVDLADTTLLTFFDASNAPLGSFSVPAGPADASLSFLGVDFGNAVVSRVRITNGNTALGPNELDGVDLVVNDDFIYGEPIAALPVGVPEPGTLAALFAGLVGLGLVYRQRGKA